MADQGTEGILSPYLRRKRFQAAAPFLKGRVLDFGCGTGELASRIGSDNYMGVEIDDGALELARQRYPQHNFSNTLPDPKEKFDTVVSLAVIEHVKDPGEFVRQLSLYLKNVSQSRLIVTTPHPSVDWIHDLGALIGLFSKHANEEHEELLDKSTLRNAAASANLIMINYRRFLWGANQIAVFRRT